MPPPTRCAPASKRDRAARQRRTRAEAPTPSSRHQSRSRGLRGCSQHCERIGSRITRERGEHFDCRLSAEQRLHERLHHRVRAVVRPCIAPRLEIVRGGNEPRGMMSRLVLVQPRVHDAHCAPHQLPEFHAGRRGVRGVSANAHERVDTPRAQRVRERRQRRVRIAAAEQGRAGVRHGATGVAERVVDLRGERARTRRDAIARDHEALPRVRLQVRGYGGDPRRAGSRPSSAPFSDASSGSISVGRQRRR